MLNNILIYISSAVIIIWGIAHITPTKSVVAGYGDISRDNKLVFIMEWIAEGITLIFIGALTLLINILNGYQNPASLNVFRISAVMLIIMAVLTAFTGARTKIVFFKICPFVKTIAAVLLLLAVYL
ncbi:MAG: hypothetical protein FJW68_10430 [Actinobacteria bacterium]|nr:hypothetical protein [Actinomycetota bacterium]